MAGFGTRGTTGTSSLGTVVVAGIDGTVGANTTLLTNNTGKNYLVTGFQVFTTTVTGYSSAPTISIGITASAYTDIVNGLTGPAANAKAALGTIVAAPNIVPNGGTLVLIVSNGASASAYKFTAVVEGMFI